MLSGARRKRNRMQRWAMRLNPQYPPGYLRVLALSLFHQERYEEAVDTLHRLVSLPSPLSEDYATLVSAYGHAGRTRRRRPGDREVQRAHGPGRVRSADGAGNGLVVVRRHVRLSTVSTANSF